ncbi:hypothetical protein SF12_05490 [Streptomyces sp. MBRL 601]|nr:hypothetical protein SF12_05490 [Streptomyces sp. MBRL 601]
MAGPPPGLQRDFANDGLESSFTLIDRDHLGRIVVAGGLSCPMVAPRAQRDQQLAPQLAGYVLPVGQLVPEGGPEVVGAARLGVGPHPCHVQPLAQS